MIRLDSPGEEAQWGGLLQGMRLFVEVFGEGRREGGRKVHNWVVANLALFLFTCRLGREGRLPGQFELGASLASAQGMKELNTHNVMIPLQVRLTADFTPDLSILSGSRFLTSFFIIF